MKKIITTWALLIGLLVTAQTKYEQGIGNALKLWGENKPEEAVALFERIANVEKDNWLPNYYVALVNTTQAFQIKDKEKINALLTKAQLAVDTEMTKDEKNSELYIMQAMINTAWIVYDPMTNGMKLLAKTTELYNKAQALDPTNPRAVSGKAEFEIGGAKYWGTDTQPMCDQLAKSIELYKAFKPQTPFHPNWGQDRAEQQLAACSKK